MPRKARTPPRKSNWLIVEVIKGVPNILSSKTMVAEIRKEREKTGKSGKMPVFCWFCGRPFVRPQSYKAHQRWCTEKKKYAAVMRDGWTFTIGGQVFTIKTNRWSWIREAATVETELNQRIANGSTLEAEAITWFHWFVLGHQATYPRADAATAAAGPAD